MVRVEGRERRGPGRFSFQSLWDTGQGVNVSHPAVGAWVPESHCGELCLSTWEGALSVLLCVPSGKRNCAKALLQT